MPVAARSTTRSPGGRRRRRRMACFTSSLARSTRRERAVQQRAGLCCAGNAELSRSRWLSLARSLAFRSQRRLLARPSRRRERASNGWSRVRANWLAVSRPQLAPGASLDIWRCVGLCTSWLDRAARGSRLELAHGRVATVEHFVQLASAASSADAAISVLASAVRFQLLGAGHVTAAVLRLAARNAVLLGHWARSPPRCQPH